MITTKNTETTTMKTIKELNKELNKIGFKVKLKSLSWGRHATFAHKETAEELRANVFSPEQYNFWKPLFDFQNTHADDLKYIAAHEDAPYKIYGLVKKT